MASRALDDKSAQKFFENLFLSEKERNEGKQPSNSKYNEINQIGSLFHSARGQDLGTTKGTLWGALNAVTYYVDHVRSSASAERIDSAWFGTGAALKEKAWQGAMDLMEKKA